MRICPFHPIGELRPRPVRAEETEMLFGPERLPRRRGGQGGFTVIEVMIACSVLLVGILALAAVSMGSVAAVSRSQQSQEASNLAASVVAEAEALPWSTISQGLSQGSDPYFNTDPNISGGCFEGAPLVVGGTATASACPSGSSPGGPTYPWQDVNGPSCSGSLATAVSGSSTLPLVPHQSCVTLPAGTGSADFEIAVYPTLHSGGAVASAGAAVEVTVVVTWGGGASAATGEDRVTDTVVLTDCGTSGPRCS